MNSISTASVVTANQKARRLKLIGGLLMFIAVTLPVIALTVRSSLKPRETSVKLPEEQSKPPPLFEQAKQVIPGALNQIYEALNQGNPRAVSFLLSELLTNNSAKLDYICTPFTYRAHYIEAIIERPNNEFQVRVRVLYQPLEERAYVLIFYVYQGSFVLEDVVESSDDWFGQEKTIAVELARNFVYAAKAGNADILRQLVSSGVETSRFVTDACWRQFFFDVNSEVRTRSVTPTSYKGLKIEVKLRLNPDCGLGWRGLGDATFLVDKVDGEYRIVSADPYGNVTCFWHPKDVCPPITILGGRPEVLAKAEDPQLEAYTLKRFGLTGK